MERVITLGLDQYLSAQTTIAKENPIYKKVVALMEGGADTGEGSVYLSGYDFYGEEKKQAYKDLVTACGADTYVDPSTPSATISRTEDGSVQVSLTVAYWRKANQIHNWFVENVQGGEDECNPFDASREKLRELVKACKLVLGRSELAEGQVYAGTTFKPGGEEEVLYEEGKVVVEPAVAQEILPTTSGFFFGSTSYDQWYIRDLEDTVSQIERALKMPPEWTLVYQSSW